MSVNLVITGLNLHTEKRFDKSSTLLKFKQRLEPICGIPSGSQCLSIYSGDQLIQYMVPFNGLSESEILLGAFYVEDGYRVHITGDNGFNDGIKLGGVHDINSVKKFEISNEEYEKLDDSVLAFKKRNKLGRFADESKEKEIYLPIPDHFKINSRCKVTYNTNSLFQLGTIRYLGETKFQPGNWVGIELDEPYGKNDGSVAGVKYFSCSPKYGSFVKPDSVEVGDFPKEDLFSDDDLDMM